MPERVIVKQDRNFHTWIWGTDPADPDSGKLIKIQHLADFSPYTMMLAGMATCTGSVVLPYARHHGLDLESVEFRVTYYREYQDEDENGKYTERIEEEMTFFGDLDEAALDKLFKIAHQCPITRMYRRGIEMNSSRVEHTLVPD